VQYGKIVLLQRQNGLSALLLRRTKNRNTRAVAKMLHL